jgi:hypothetical protein
MLEVVRAEASARRLRLLAVACVRSIEEPPDLGVAERFADGAATPEDLAGECRLLDGLLFRLANTTGYDGDARLHLAWGAAHADAWEAAREVTHPYPAYRCRERARAARDHGASDPALHCRLLRCIFGNPFRPRLPFAPSVLTANDGAAVKLATVIYNDRDPSTGLLDVGRLAILADALEEAGAVERLALDHLRGPGPHARGCFVVDALLGRS